MWTGESAGYKRTLFERQRNGKNKTLERYSIRNIRYIEVICLFIFFFLESAKIPAYVFFLSFIPEKYYGPTNLYLYLGGVSSHFVFIGKHLRTVRD